MPIRQTGGSTRAANYCQFDWQRQKAATTFPPNRLNLQGAANGPSPAIDRGVTSTSAIAAPQTPFPVVPGTTAAPSAQKGNARIQTARRTLPALAGIPTASSSNPGDAGAWATFDAIVSEMVSPEPAQTTVPVTTQGPPTPQVYPGPVRIQVATNLPQPVQLQPSADGTPATAETLAQPIPAPVPHPASTRRNGPGLVQQFSREPHCDDGNGDVKTPTAVPVAVSADHVEPTTLRFTLTPPETPEPTPASADATVTAPQRRSETLIAPAAMHIQIHGAEKIQSQSPVGAELPTPNPSESTPAVVTPVQTATKAQIKPVFDAAQPAPTARQVRDSENSNLQASDSEADAKEGTLPASPPRNYGHPLNKDEVRPSAVHSDPHRNAGELQHEPQSAGDSSPTRNVDHAPVDAPAVRPQTHVAVPVDAAVPRAERQTAPAVDKPVESAAPIPPETKDASTQPLRSVSLEFTPDGLSDVRLRLSERSGEVHISVHSNDPSMHGKLQDGIHDLIGTLSNAGYDANAWTPGQSRENHQRQREATPNPRRKDTPGAGAEDFGGLLNNTTQEGA